jgi:hypothetical protein
LVEEGIEFLNDQVMELQILHRMATSKTMEEKYLQRKRDKMEEKSKGPVKRSNQVSALNGLVAVQEDEQQSSIPGMVTYLNVSNKRSKSQLGGGRRISSGLEHTSSLSTSNQSGGGGDNADDESSEDPSNNYYPPRNHAQV